VAGEVGGHDWPGLDVMPSLPLRGQITTQVGERKFYMTKQLLLTREEKLRSWTEKATDSGSGGCM
jgi:hypothetical protein